MDSGFDTFQRELTSIKEDFKEKLQLAYSEMSREMIRCSEEHQREIVEFQKKNKVAELRIKELEDQIDYLKGEINIKPTKDTKFSVPKQEFVQPRTNNGGQHQGFHSCPACSSTFEYNLLGETITTCFSCGFESCVVCKIMVDTNHKCTTTKIIVPQNVPIKKNPEKPKGKTKIVSYQLGQTKSQIEMDENATVADLKKGIEKLHQVKVKRLLPASIKDNDSITKIDGNRTITVHV